MQPLEGELPPKRGQHQLLQNKTAGVPDTLANPEAGASFSMIPS